MNADNEKKQYHNGIETSSRRLLEDCIYTSMEHFDMASILSSVRIGIGVASSVAAGTIVIVISLSLHGRDFIVPICSFIALIGSTLLTTLNPGAKSSIHERIGNEYLSLRKNIQDFVDVDLNNNELSDPELRSKLAEMRESLDSLYQKYSDVIIPDWIRYRVLRKIKSGEANYDFEERK